MGQVLSAPVSSKNLERRGNKFLKVGSCEMQGYRVNMEDTHTIQLSLEGKHQEKSFFAVFDGHGGDKASVFLAEKLWQAVSKLDEINKETLSKCVQKLDEDFLKSKEEDRENGSTAVFAVVEPVKSGGEVKSWNVIIGNLGDSRAIVVRSDGKLESLTKDHKPETKEEELRIQKAGGFVRQNRVDGQLAMSRAIGDSKYKDQSNLKPAQQKVIAVPDIETVTVEKGDRLLLYCDGIVEQMQNEDVSTFIHKELKEVKSKDQDPASVLVRLIELSLSKGSKDNMSALMIIFEDGSDYHQTKNEFIAGPFHPHKGDEAFKNAYLADAKRYGYEGEKLMEMARKAEEQLKSAPIPQSDPQGPNMMLKSLIQSLASNLGGLPGENREEKAMALMAFLQGGQFDVSDSDGDTPMKSDTSESDTENASSVLEVGSTSTTTSTSGQSETSTSSDTEITSPSSPSPSSPTGKKKKKKKKKKNNPSTS